MLSTLYIENIAVIEEAELSPERGFNVLTGETGAGKSMILDAIHAITGARTSRELVRTGQEKASVRALFTELSPRAQELLAENGIAPEENSVLLSREIYADGRNVCRAGGKPCPLQLLRDLGAELVSIHGQHDGRQLLDPGEHLGLLDAYAGSEKRLAAYRVEYTRARDLRHRILELERDAQERARRMDLLQYQIRELSEAEVRPGELAELTERRHTLENAGKIVAALRTAADCLGQEQGAGGAAPLLSAAGRELVRIAPLSPEAGKAADRAAELVGAAERLQGELISIAEGLDAGPEELAAIRERMELLSRLLKKYGGTEAEAVAYLARAESELSTLSGSENLAASLAEEYSQAIAAARERAAELTAHRKQSAERLARAVEKELAYLEMPRCVFRAEFAENGKLSPTGADRMEFYLAANPGEEPKPLAKIASGGELSRIMLALRNVFRGGAGRTLIFDEIDAGVSGRAAQRVGEKLYGASRGNQVLCVTHLTQIAAMGDAHFLVRKEVRGGRTRTEVLRLDPDARAEELARITGGFRISETLLSGAREQLREAENYKKTLEEK